MIIIADASPLIALAIIRQLGLLANLFDKVNIPEAVFKEITQPNKAFSNEIEIFAKPMVKAVKNDLAL